MTRIEAGFTDADRATIAALYWEAFGPKLGRALGSRAGAEDYVSKCLMPEHAICARNADGKVIGVIGFKTMKGGLVEGGFAPLRAHFGLVGASWRYALLSALPQDVDNTRFLIDGLFVAEEARGSGLGTRLVWALAEEARARGYRQMRLEVVDTNLRAKALYHRLGFVAAGRIDMGLRALIFGYDSATTMVLDL